MATMLGWPMGGDWELTRLDGTKGGSVDLRGNFALIYFGFTHCPGTGVFCFGWVGFLLREGKGASIHRHLQFSNDFLSDICPEEIEKAVKVVDNIDANANITKVRL